MKKKTPLSGGKYLSNNVAVCDSDEDQSMANIQESFLIVQVKIGKKRIKLEQYSSPILHHTKNKKKKTITARHSHFQHGSGTPEPKESVPWWARDQSELAN